MKQSVACHPTGHALHSHFCSNFPDRFPTAGHETKSDSRTWCDCKPILSLTRLVTDIVDTPSFCEWNTRNARVMV